MRGILDELGSLEGTDKNELTHDYLRHYERLVGALRDDPFTLLEIGVAGGGSLRTWSRYFTRATIVGVDINPDCRKHAGERRIVEIGSQAEQKFLDGLGAKYQPTVIIDDGSHRADHILFAFDVLYPYLRPGGLYIIEDLHFHIGEQGKALRGEASVAPLEHFARLSVGVACPGSVDDPIVRSMDSIEFFHGCVAVRKREEARVDSIAQKRALVERANRAEIWSAFAGYVLMHGGDPTEAANAARRAVQLSPTSAGFYNQLSAALERVGDRAGAIAAVQQAVSLDPNYAPFRDRLSDLAASVQ
jgi:tetratricopeptide (TPR) repeat protein